jgi:hypothetical protein
MRADRRLYSGRYHRPDSHRKLTVAFLFRKKGITRITSESLKTAGYHDETSQKTVATTSILFVPNFEVTKLPLLSLEGSAAALISHETEVQGSRGSREGVAA